MDDGRWSEVFRWLIDQTTLEAKIRRGIEEYEQGKVHKMEEGESVDGFLSRMINEE